MTAAAAAAVAEAEAEERALAAALEAIARLPPRPDRGPRRSLCVEVSLFIKQINNNYLQKDTSSSFSKIFIRVVKVNVLSCLLHYR